MKIKLLFFSLLCLAMGGSLFAQQQVQSVNGVLTLNLVPGINAFKVIVGQTITSVVFQNPTPGSTTTVIFTENAAGGFGVTFGGNISNPCTVATTANATTICTFTYDASANTWFGASGGGGGGAVSSVFGRTGAVAATAGDYTFDKIGAGSNLNALQIGTGGSISPTGTGTVNANQVNGAAPPTSKTIVGTNSSGQVVDASAATLANSTTGNAATATALATTPTLCSTGSAPTGILASGNATGCAATLSNPMTTVGDMIGGGASGVPTRIVGGLTGQIPTFTNGATPSAKSPGVPGTDVNASTYTVQCDSATALVDRLTTIRFITTAPTVTMPDPTASGCGSNFPVTLIASGVTATVNRTTTATFNIYNGSTVTTGATTFNLTTGQYATLTSPDNANWLVRVVSGGGGGSTALTSVTKTASYTVVAGDFTTPSIIVFTCTAACTVTLPASAPAANSFVVLSNQSVFPLTVAPNGVNLNGATTSVPLGYLQGMIVSSTGSVYTSKHDTGTQPLDESSFDKRWDFCQGSLTPLDGEWAISNGTGATIATVAPTFPEFCGVQASTGTTSPSGGYLLAGDTPAISHLMFPALGTNAGWEIKLRFSIGQTTTTKLYIGLVNTLTGNTVVPTNWMGLRYDTSLGTPDAAFTFVTQTTATCPGAGCNTLAFTTVNTSVHTLRMRSITANEIRMSIDNSSEYCFTTSATSPGCGGGNATSAVIPAGGLDGMFGLLNTTTTNVTAVWYNFYIRGNGLSRD